LDIPVTVVIVPRHNKHKKSSIIDECIHKGYFSIPQLETQIVDVIKKNFSLILLTAYKIIIYIISVL
jgi:hypothetical protein